MPARAQNASQHVLTKLLTCPRRINMGLPKYPMPVRIENASQHVLTKPLQCQQGHKNVFYICWPNRSHVNEDSKCTSPSDTTMYFNMRWSNSSHASEDTKCSRKPSHARTLNASQHVFTKPLPCQRGHKSISTCPLIPPYAKEGTICISTCVTKPLTCPGRHKMYLNMGWPKFPMPVRIEIASQHVLTKPI